MSSFLSPGVYTIEKDISEYAPTLNSSIVGIVGFASKGVLNKSTLITSAESLINTFGKPSEALYGQGLEAALEILEATNQVYFIRAGDLDAAVDASAYVPIGSPPIVQVMPSGYGFTESAVFKIQATDSNGVNVFSEPKTFSVPSGTVTGSYVGGINQAQYTAMRQVIGGSLASNKIFVGSRSITIGQDNVPGHIFIGSCYAGSGASITVSAFEIDGTTPLLVVSGVNQVNSSINSQLAASWPVAPSVATAYGTTVVAPSYGDGVAYRVKSLNPGEGYNLSTNSNGDTVGISAEIDQNGDTNSIFTVNSEGAAIENFNVSLIESPGQFIEGIINIGTVNPVSEFVQGVIVSGSPDGLTIVDLDWAGIPEDQWGFKMTNTNIFPGATLSGTANNSATIQSIQPMMMKLADSTNGLSGGDNGDSAIDSVNDTLLIGDATSEPKTGLQLLDDPTIDISIGLVPGIYSQSVQNELITLAESTENFLALVSPPEGVGGVQDAIDWTNGQADTRTAAINSSYAAVYWPHVKTFSVFDGLDRFYDPSIYGARQMVYTDSVAEPWFAPAGYVRGRLTKPTETEVVLNQGDRDALYSGGNIINPIVNFPQQGITIFGQRTAQRLPSALDRINVRRLMIVIKKTILASTQAFVFEPHDPITWNRIESVVQPILNDVKRRRGITEFRVVCDSTTNTSIRIDRNELWCKVLIKPTKTAEIIVFELNLTSQSAKLG